MENIGIWYLDYCIESFCKTLFDYNQMNKAMTSSVYWTFFSAWHRQVFQQTVGITMGSLFADLFLYWYMHDAKFIQKLPKDERDI